MKQITLTEHEKDTPLAMKLRDHYKQRLDSLRAKNDECPMEKTEKLRGRIAEAKNFINVLSKNQAFEIESSDSE